MEYYKVLCKRCKNKVYREAKRGSVKTLTETVLNAFAFEMYENGMLCSRCLDKCCELDLDEQNEENESIFIEEMDDYE